MLQDAKDGLSQRGAELQQQQEQAEQLERQLQAAQHRFEPYTKLNCLWVRLSETN